MPRVRSTEIASPATPPAIDPRGSIEPPRVRVAAIRPGILVSLKTSTRGGVSYATVDETGKTAEEIAADARARGVRPPAVKKWTTTRTIDDPEEYEAAKTSRSRAAALVRRHCVATTFGLLCPFDAEPALDAGFAEARKIVDLHNDGAATTRVAVYMIKGRVAGTDEEAARSIVGEVRDLIDAMNEGVKNLDSEAVREAASKAKELSIMLSPEKSAVVGEAVAAARSASRVIVSRYEKKGEAAAVVLADLQRGAIERARMDFLDLDEPAGATKAASIVEVARFDDAIDDEAVETTEAEADPAAPPSAARAASEVLDREIEEFEGRSEEEARRENDERYADSLLLAKEEDETRNAAMPAGEYVLADASDPLAGVL